ncbi:hypothetical protein pA_gene0043 [Aeromonas phage phiA008]|nr:hypothetical protein pA_gene0043 [Aeromonas phage phiA008]
MKELPKLFRTTWDEIHALEAQKKAILADISNHLYIDFETFFSEDYSLTKKDMTYLKFIKHQFFKIQSAAVRIGNGKTHYFREAGEIRDYIEEALIENPDLVLVAQQAFFDGGIVRYHFGLEFKYCIDLPSLSRAVWPNAMFHNLNAIGERLYPGDKSKQKSDDIAFTKGVYNWTDLIHERNERYNIQDTDLLAEFVQYFVNGGFPHDVLLQQSIVNMMYFKPSFHADVPLLTKARNEAEKRQEEAVQAAIKFLQENARVNKHFWITMADRDKTKYPTQKAYNEIYRRTFGMPPMKDKSELRKVLTSNDKFAYLLEKGFDIPVPLKQGSSKIDPDAMTYALGKNDVEFQAMMTAHRDLAVVWTGRMESKSNQEKTRATTFLEYADLCDGFIPVPLRNSAAHTHRLGGTESINMQNLGRKSPCRPALTGGGVYAINATDSSNIESRVSAWFCGHEEKLDLFRRGGDPYNETATVIFGYPVDRKSKTVDHSMQGAVGKATDLGCGYQMGADRFRDYLNAGPLGMDPIFLEDIPELAKYPNPYKYVIDKYRRANYPIKDMWDTLQSTIFDMARKSCDYELGPLLVRHERIWLPSGLSLHYPGLHKTKEGNWAYESRDGGLSFLFGGKLLENIIQALSQIIILRQMVWISCYLELVYGDEARTALQVHDEVVSAFPLEGAELTGYTDRGEPIWKNGEKIKEVSADITAIMHRTDGWFDGIPIGAEGETHLQYS